MATVSVIILARNEEHNIHDCIESVQFADEVLVIDDFSTDNTVTIAEDMGARVVQHAMNGDWGHNKPLVLNKLSPTGFYSSMRMSVFLSHLLRKFKTS